MSCEADFFIERRMQKERQSLSFCGGDDYYLLGVLIPPWNRPKSRSERCDNSKRSIYPTPGGNINISYKDSALLGLRQVHSDSEGGFRKYTICSDKELHFPDDEETRATVEKKVAPISSITMCNISDVPAPPKLSMAATSKVLLKLTKGIANVTNGTSNSEELLHLQEVLGNTLILMLPLSISQRVVVSFQIATSKRVVRLSGSTVLDKLFRALPWEFSREEQGYRLVPLCINDQVGKFLFYIFYMIQFL